MAAFLAVFMAFFPPFGKVAKCAKYATPPTSQAWRPSFRGRGGSGKAPPDPLGASRKRAGPTVKRTAGHPWKNPPECRLSVVSKKTYSRITNKINHLWNYRSNQKNSKQGEGLAGSRPKRRRKGDTVNRLPAKTTSGANRPGARP
jgi:hypothetical protein